MDEKGSIGFPTPSKEILDTSAKLLDTLKQKRENWERMRSDISNLAKPLVEKNEPTVEDTIILWVYLANMAINKIGIQLTETQETIVSLEKNIKDLRLRKS
jgi:hypothetical protein